MITSRRNSLNFLRLVLAVLVIGGHAVTRGGHGLDDVFHKITIGTLAVFGFFGLSGYLIAASADHLSPGRYLWHRFLRIFPAFWVCLVVTAFVFGAIGWAHAGGRGLGPFLRATKGPIGYVTNNFWLRMTQLQVAHTPVGVPFPLVWNGSLWSLFYEFICYLIAGALAVLGLLRRSWTVAALAVAVWVAEAIICSVPSFNVDFTPFGYWDALNLLTLVPVFLAGSLLYLYRDRVPDSGLLALLSTGIFLLSLWMPLGSSLPSYSMTSASLMAPALVYPLLWLGAHLPFQKIGARNDYSYGAYIYAFPVQQTLALWGVYRWGWVAYTVLSVIGTAPLAIASWWVVERPVMSLRQWTLRPAHASS